MKIILFLALAAIFPLISYGQCTNCKLEETFNYCYTDSLYENYCAGFTDGSDRVVFTSGKKVKEAGIPLDETEKAFISMANNRKLKLRAMEVLFLQKAVEKWSVERRKIGYSFTDSGLGIKILKQGQGELPESGKMVTVHYTGWLLSGEKFDSSKDRNKPFSFPLGQGRVIKGWDEGVATLKKGTKALLYIPPELGYGKRGAGGSIPPNSTLIFEVEILD
jgi:FKBP-type peptidyl-prolyl cis-trans isomerase